jgi:glycine cleavage system H protein
MDPRTLRYTATHEWIGRDGDAYVIGITKFATDQLSDVTFLELPKLGAKLVKGKEFGTIETVKAVNSLYAPVDGVVAAVNDRLVKDPPAITQDAYGESWVVKIKLAPGASLDHLLTLDQYEKQIASEGH